MEGLKFNVHFAFFILSLTIIMNSGQSATVPNFAVKSAYWPSYSELPPSAINTSFFTHIYYAFLNPSNITYKLEVSDSTAVLLSNFTTTLHRKNPPVKTLFSIGGGGSDSDLFARIASDYKSSQVFVNSSLEIARQFGFDGLDLDWEFPQSPKEMKDLGRLFKQWRSAIQEEAIQSSRPALLLTAAVYYSVEFSSYGDRRTYPVPEIVRNVDWVSAMCFDYHGSWDTSETGAHAALFDPNTNLSSIYGLGSWIRSGLPSHKLVMGMPLYAKTWELKDPQVNGVGAPAVGVGPGDNGILTFAQVVEFNKENNATVAYDVDTISAYSFVNRTWIGFDDAITVTTKIGFAQALGLRGYFFWSINQDSNWTISSQASRTWILHK